MNDAYRFKGQKPFDRDLFLLAKFADRMVSSLLTMIFGYPVDFKYLILDAKFGFYWKLGFFSMVSLSDEKLGNLN